MQRQTLLWSSQFLTRVMPLVSNELKCLRKRAAAISHPIARREALASLRHKAFHVHGGCVLATFLPSQAAVNYVRLVAAFETAVDYLDNLCDRAGSSDEADFRALHESLQDAVTPGAPLRRYFRRRDYDDGGYLDDLVSAAQRGFACLASFAAIAPGIAFMTRRYCELQALKHLPAGEREVRCKQAFGATASDLEWWEGAAASGSTMPTFALAYAAVAPGFSVGQAGALREVYFPYFSALHILLDYFIDQAEDRVNGELNFVACYPSVDLAVCGLVRIAREALHRIQELPDSEKHAFVLRAMCAFYCSRPKVARQALSGAAKAILNAVDAGSIGPLSHLLRLYARLARA